VGQVLCPVLVGRQSEMQALERALDDARAGRGNCVVIAGEAGIGKSRLVRELLTLATSRGVAVASGRSVPASGSAPYRPISEALLGLLRDRPIPSDPSLVGWLPHLGAIAPAALMTGAEAPALDPSGSPAVRGEAVLQLCRRLAPDGLVVALEDLHWAAPDTLAVVEYLADNAASQAMLLVLTLRSDPPSPAADLVRRQRGRTGIAPLPLQRLSRADITRMIDACDPTADPGLRARVASASEGVPLLIEDLLASPGIPESITETVRTRLAEFSPAERAVIEAAAVLGRHFDWELLPAASGSSSDETSAALAHAVDRQLIVTDGPGFHFRHALTRDAVLHTMLPPRVRAVAGRVLAALDAAQPEPDGSWRDVAAEVASLAGQSARAGRLLLESGRHSLAIGALATATDTLTRAESLLADARERVTAQKALVEALALAGRVDDAVSAGHRLMTGRTGEPISNADRADTHLQLAQAAVTASRWELARQHLDEVHRATDAVDVARRARAAVLTADIALASDDLASARTAAQDVLALDGVSPDVRCHAFEIVGRACRLRDLRAASAAFESALAEAEAAGLPVWRLRAMHELGTVDMFERLDLARLLAARQLGEQMGALSTVAVLDLQLAAAFTGRWDLDECDSHARAAAEIAGHLGLALVRAKALALMVGSASMRADLPATQRLAAEAAKLDPGDPVLEGFFRASTGTALYLAGRIDEALPALADGTQILAGLPNPEPMSIRALWPLIQAAAGDDRAAETIAVARRTGVEAFYGNAALLLMAEAVLAGRSGRPRHADQLAGQAAEGFRNTGAWVDLAHFIAAPSARADGWGRPDAWEAAGRERFAGLGLVSARAANPWAADGVTEREAEVLTLVVAGLANKQIAARLQLSVRTVEKHVENLLRKTGARSRTELAVGAARPRT
jgi:DNA-binding CsgD family transcriptional regulator